MACGTPNLDAPILRRAAFLLWWIAIVGSPSRAQVVRGSPDTTAVAVDSSDVASVARGAQASFERIRVRHLPRTYGSFGGSCDEVVGRICVTFGEGEWYPGPEASEIVDARRALIAELDSLQTLVPRDSWILGQRVWYRAEAGAWETALATARECGPEGGRSWWCLALEGFALHGLGRYGRSQAAFDEALSGMDRDRARRWSIPRWPVEGRVRDVLDEAREGEGREDAGVAEPTDRVHALVERLWTLADPLYLVEGNDRRTAHLARWVASEIRSEARNPFRLRWGDDLTELTVRHGWQKGWERIPARSPSYRDQVIGHDHPLGRDYMPSAEALLAPATAEPEAMVPRLRRPRSLYAPEYAPVLLPMDGQLAVFPRGETMVVVSSHFLPADTTHHASHDHPKPWLEAAEQASMPSSMGL
ncbi:MAG: hypothetical protein R3304_05190, partial [Longimicrobiales bacterium]|nr:hypothetical protein [Longimicrobiales bacterium]